MISLSDFISIFKRAVKDFRKIGNTPLKLIFFYFDYIVAYFIHGASPRDYVLCEMYKKSMYERSLHLTMRRARRVEKWYNNPKYVQIFNLKNLFNQKFNEFVKRDWILTSTSNYSDIYNFITRHNSFIYKPTNLSSGKGIKKYITKEIYNIDEFITQCQCDNILLEECIKQSYFYSRLNTYSVNSMRFYTIVTNTGDVKFLAAGLKAGTTKSVVDNMHDNGIWYPLDVDSGIVKSYGMDIRGNRYTHHPNTEIKMMGLEIPDYDKLKSFVKRAALLMPECRYIGWDVAVTDNGFEMIEGNVTPYIGDVQVYDNIGYYHVLKQFKIRR